MNLNEQRNAMRTTLTTLFAAGELAVSAQNANVVNAYNYMQDGDLAKAAEYIEPAISHEATMGKDKTWRYRGDIYRMIGMGTDDALKAQFPDAMQKAIDSYLKAEELDEKGRYKDEHVKALGALQGASLNAGNAAFGEKDFDKAVAMYGQAQRIAQAFGQVDTNAVYNTALAYESAGNTAEALKAYRQVLDLGYDKVEVYRFMAQLQARQEDWDGAVATVREGRAKHPEDADLLKDELVYLLRAGRGNESEGVLTEALKKNPNDPILLSIQGSQYEEKLGAAEDQATKDELFGKAEGAYKAAIEADPEFFDAYFNIGVLYNNRAADMYEQCNSIKSDKEYMACKEKADAVYLAAKPYFEQAHNMKPDDAATIQQLMKLYAKTNDTAKFQEMKAKLGE